MTGNDIRKKFLAFFKSKGHTIVESDSVVPKDDPTVLFTTAGMQQFKRQFLGHIDEYTCAATSQKCLRTDDLDKVGETDFHHTFFEMLGNFSFGDYFKKEAIVWAWEFFTQELKIPRDRLWVSVYKDDKEAEDIWRNEIKIDPRKIFKLGDKSNFWPSEAKEKGPNGPCGPCSEIFYDFDPGKNTFPKDPDDEGDRFCEVWNLVFTQFNRKEGGVLEPLPNKNIDTGMGLERLTAVIQGKRNNFETDLFAPILSVIDKEITGLSLKDKRIMADHIRAIVFGIADGVVPSNEGRGYVIKKLIIDITDKAIQNGRNDPAIHKLVPGVVTAMADAYPDIKKKANEIASIIKNIESAYIKVRQERIPELEKKFAEIKQLPEPQRSAAMGEVMFKYRDTYGLTLPTISTTAIRVGVTIGDKDKESFETLMKQQQNQSRARSKMTGDVFTRTELTLDVEKTKFLGYEEAECTAKILKLFIGNKEVHEASKGDQVKIILDRTPFYAESGGQVGDTGAIIIDGKNIVRIQDTQKMDEVFIHIGIVENGIIKSGNDVNAIIDVDRRLSIMRNHTATHLLQTALREVLGSHIKQQGSLVDENRLRFDFTHPKPITKEQLQEIEDLINVFIRACDAVDKEVMPIEKARESGALAFFAEKYGKTVRVVSINGYSKEFCGGTHLGSTGQIGIFKIISESAIAQGIRRIEATTGVGALNQIKKDEAQLDNLANILKSAKTDLIDKAQKQTERIKELEKKFAQLQFESIKNSLEDVIAHAEAKNGAKIVHHLFKDADMDSLKKASDLLKQKAQSSVIVLGANMADNAALLVSVTDDLVKKGVNANDIIEKAATIMDGKGGGRPNMAQAGSKNPNKLNEALKHAVKTAKEKIQ